MNIHEEKIFKEIFEKSLRLNARSMSIKTLLSERNLNRINYTPYYQRNYVWDITKQSFFIESVILGTEIPPLILFNTGNKIEVIDGRQRFETLKRFKENDIKLKSSGLRELQKLNNESFNTLSPENKEIFLESNIRIFEFEIINQPELSDDLVDNVKKEIFQRYNTGITPLKKEEVDNAKYDNDEFSDKFKSKLNEDNDFYICFNQCFFPNEKYNDNEYKKSIVSKNLTFVRKYRVFKEFPITTYAGGNKNEILDLLYDFAKNNAEDIDKEYNLFFKSVQLALNVYKKLSTNSEFKNRLIYECILWAISILLDEDIELNLNIDKMKIHYKDNIGKYSTDDSFQYSYVLGRFKDTATLFSHLHDFDFSNYIRDEKFRHKIQDLKQTEIDAAKSIEKLSHLRLNKPTPISTPIDDLRNDLKSTKYMLRPTYQRQEKINVLKASSIIESILLGLNLPPIFIYKRKNGVKEVVDGQQRLLAIIGFLGEQFYNENGDLDYSRNNNFKLHGLKILKKLEKSNYSSLDESFRDKILDFDIELIIIEERVNEDFDPIDLFIRLNYKPYPIKANSFEMWNSIVDQSIIRRIRDIVNDESKSNWFYLREVKENTPDRMQNEEMVCILSYLLFSLKTTNLIDINEVLGFFTRQDRITCRLKDKKAISDFLTNRIRESELVKNDFLESIEQTCKMIDILSGIFTNTKNKKDEFNVILNVRKSRTFRRSLQDFYIIWLLLGTKYLENDDIDYQTLKLTIIEMLRILKNTGKAKVDESYTKSFIDKLNKLTNLEIET